jgi:hypothetical protein
MEQKILLGMDFMIGHGVCIDMAKGTISITTPEPTQPSTLCSRTSITLQPQETFCFTLTSADNQSHAAILVHPDKSLEDGCMLWQGVYSMQQGKTRTWLTNVSGHVLRIQEGTPIAHWEPDSSGEIAMADRLYSSAL